MRYLLFTLFAFTFCSAAMAQSTIDGKILDAKSKEPVPFANIVLKGTYAGTATNYDGEFVLKIPQKNMEDSLLISVVGYKPKTLSVKPFLGKSEQVFEIEPFTYQMEDITVETKSQFYHTVIKKAAERIDKNYYQGPFNYTMYYRNAQLENGKTTKERQAAVKLYDAQGYEKSSVFKVFKERGYEFMQVRRDFELTSLSDGSTQLDDLLEFDVVRLKANVLNPEYIYDYYDVELNRITEVDGDSVWVLDFTCTEPGLSLTGDYYATAYSGQVFIKKKDYSLIKYKAHFECGNYSSLGRSLYVNEENQALKPVNIEYDVVTRYKEFNGKYFLSSVTYNRDHTWQVKANNKRKTEQINAELLVTDIKLKNPDVIQSRAYYEEIPFDKEFWQSFNYLKDEE